MHFNPKFLKKRVLAAWGAITGTLSNQTDLQAALNAKLNTTDDNLELTGNLTLADSSHIIIGSNTWVHFTTGGGDNTFFGKKAGGSSISSSAINNTCIGSRAGEVLTDGLANTFLGYAAGLSCTTASSNTCIGNGAGSSITTSVGSNNTCVGTGAGTAITTSANNTIIGQDAGSSISSFSGTSNTIIGKSAGVTITTGLDNVVIGRNADVTSASSSNRIVVGRGASGDTNNEAVIGNASIVTWKAGANDTCILGTSAKRFKGAYFTGLHIRETANHTIHKGTSPTITAGGGTSPSIAGKDEAFTVTIGTGGIATSFEVTFANAFTTNAPVPSAMSDTDIVAFKATALTNKVTITATAPFTAGSKVHVICRGWE